MENLLNGKALPSFRIPYTGGVLYDSEGFYSFPRRAGWYMRADGQWIAKGKASIARRSGPLSSLAAFLQAWLFFGLMEEVMGLSVHLNPEDFRKQDIMEYGILQRVYFRNTSKRGVNIN